MKAPKKRTQMGAHKRSYKNYDGKDEDAITHQEIETPLELVSELLEYVNPDNYKKVLDPCVGPGNMVKELSESGKVEVLTIMDIQEKHVN